MAKNYADTLSEEVKKGLFEKRNTLSSRPLIYPVIFGGLGGRIAAHMTR